MVLGAIAGGVSYEAPAGGGKMAASCGCCCWCRSCWWISRRESKFEAKVAAGPSAGVLKGGLSNTGTAMECDELVKPKPLPCGPAAGVIPVKKGLGPGTSSTTAERELARNIICINFNIYIYIYIKKEARKGEQKSSLEDCWRKREAAVPSALAVDKKSEDVSAVRSEVFAMSRS